LRFFNTILPLLLLIVSTTFLAGAQSVLRTGDWFKMGIEKNGVYKIDHNFLRKAGLNPDNIDPKKIKIFGNSGGMLPQLNSTARPNDLTENAIFVSGASDGKFNKEDFILFYAEGAHKLTLNETRKIFEYENNLYSDKNFYFLTVAEDAGKRIEMAEDLGPGFPEVSDFNDCIVHESDISNELSSGREWYGEKFGLTKELILNLNVSGIKNDSEIKIVSDVIGQSYTSATFQVYLNNFLIGEQKPLPIANARYATKGTHQRDTFFVNTSSFNANAPPSNRVTCIRKQ